MNQNKLPAPGKIYEVVWHDEPKGFAVAISEPTAAMTATPPQL